MKKCQEIQIGFGTGGNPIYKWKCFCNTTICGNTGKASEEQFIRHFMNKSCKMCGVIIVGSICTGHSCTSTSKNY